MLYYICAMNPSNSLENPQPIVDNQFMLNSSGRAAALVLAGWATVRLLTGAWEAVGDAQPPIVHSVAEVIDPAVDSTPMEEGLHSLGVLGLGLTSIEVSNAIRRTYAYRRQNRR
jgi:hypothetical protein